MDGISPAGSASIAPLNDVLVQALNAQLDFARKAVKASVEAGIQIDHLGTIIDLLV